MEMARCRNGPRKRTANSCAVQLKMERAMTVEATEIMDMVDHLPIDMKLELIDHLLESIRRTVIYESFHFAGCRGQTD